LAASFFYFLAQETKHFAQVRRRGLFEPEGTNDTRPNGRWPCTILLRWTLLMLFWRAHWDRPPARSISRRKSCCTCGISSRRLVMSYRRALERGPNPYVPLPRGEIGAGSCGRERRRSIGFNIKGHVKAALTINGAEGGDGAGFPKIRPSTSLAAAHGRKRGLPRAISSDRDKTGHGASSVDPRHMSHLRLAIM
jgi:hypothetical protein